MDDYDDTLRVFAPGAHRAVSFKTQAYPGFPTDLQQPMSALLTTARGTSTVIETIYDARFHHLNEMQRMGAQVRIEGRTAVINGVIKLHGAPVAASDLRAGAALIIAGLMADGQTEIRNVHFIERGYENIDLHLRSLGADIHKA